jgi:transcriptional regulator with XRE-family HTH domain
VNTTLVRQNLSKKFKHKDYRDAFVAEQIFSRLPLKIRHIREDQELTQRQLGKLAKIAQTWVSKLEDPNYGKLTISTLLKLASAFDVGLHIDFVPFSRVLDGALQLLPASFSVPKFEDDKGFIFSPGVLGGACNAYVDENISAGNLYEFPLQGTLGSLESAMIPPGSASPITNLQPAA